MQHYKFPKYSNMSKYQIFNCRIFRNYDNQIAFTKTLSQTKLSDL